MARQKIRVLETIRQGQIGGGETHLLDLVEHLDKSEFEPVVLSFTDGPMIDRLQQLDIPVHIIPTTRPFDMTKWASVKTFIEQQQVDLVHAHGARACSNVFWASHKLHRPLVYTIHGWSFHDDQNPIVRTIRTKGEQVLTQRADVNISVSASNQATGHSRLSNFQSVVINNGINLQKFDPSRSLGNLRAELGISSEAIVVSFVARFTHQKQPITLLNAFAQAVKQNPKLHLLMVGDGEQRADVDALVSQLPCQDRITLTSFRQGVPAVLAAADIYVLPSLWEGLSIALLEAMSMGKAIIATRTDGTKEVIVDQKNGILIGLDNLEVDLTSALVRLSRDTEQQQKLGNEARQTIATGFDAATMTDTVASIYRQLVC